RRMGRAADGNERYAQAFAELGVNLRDSEGNLRGIDDVLPEIADGFARVTDETDRARLATTIMNNAGMELLPMLARGAEGIDELRERAQELGIVLSDEGVDALAAYEQKTSELQAQFRGVRNELSAALIPLLTNVLLPAIQQYLVPAFQNITNRVTDFMNRMQDAGDAGNALRSRIASWMAPIVRLYHAVAASAQGWQTLGHLAAGAVGAVGAFIGDLSVQVVAFAQSMARLEDGLKWWQQGNILGAIEMFSGLKDLDWPDWRQAGEAAGEVFAEGVDRAAVTGMSAREHLVKVGSVTSETLAADIERAMVDSGQKAGDDFAWEFSDAAGEVIPTELSGHIVDGVEEAARDPKLQEALDNLAVSGMATIPEGPQYTDEELREQEAALEAFTDTFEREEARRERIAQYHEDERQRAAERNAARRREVQEAYSAWLESELHRRAQTVMALQPDEGVTSQISRVITANRQLAESVEGDAAAARTSERYREARDAAKEWAERNEALADGLATVDVEVGVFGESTDTLNKRIRLQTEYVLGLAETYPDATREIAAAKAELDALNNELERMGAPTALQAFATSLADAGDSLVGLRSRVAAVTGTAPTELELLREELERIAEAGGLAGVGAHALLGELNTFEINEAKNALTELHAEIDGIGAGHDVFDDMADRIHEIAVEANLSADAVAELLAALDNKRAQKTVADISKTVTNLSDDLKSLTSDGANPFH